MKKIAIVTYAENPSIQPDDLFFADVLKSRSIEISSVSWDDKNADWSDFDLVIIRSTWDYFKRENEFRLWLNDMENQKVNLMNPVSVIRENMEKSYLKKFEQNGIQIIPTEWIQQDSHENLSEILKRKNWNEVVVKPIVSAGSYETFVTSTDEAENGQVQFENILKNCGVMIQPFMKEIEDGEISMLFFNRKFSHAVIKKPKDGDFRVQPKFGSTISLYQPDEKLLKTARQIIEQVDQPLLYARVDGVISNNQFLLMELELIEPMLFLSFDENSGHRFAEAVMERL